MFWVHCVFVRGPIVQKQTWKDEATWVTEQGHRIRWMKAKTLTLHKQIWPWCRGHPPQTNHPDTRKETREKRHEEEWLWGNVVKRIETSWCGSFQILKKKKKKTRIKIVTFVLRTFSLKFSIGWNFFPLRASKALISCTNEHINHENRCINWSLLGTTNTLKTRQTD